MTNAERQERREMWLERVMAFRESGQSVAAWCRAHELKEHQMRYWLRRLSSGSSDVPVSTQWLSMTIDQRADSLDQGILVQVGQVTIQVRPGFNRALLADVVDALASPC